MQNALHITLSLLLNLLLYILLDMLIVLSQINNRGLVDTKRCA